MLKLTAASGWVRKWYAMCAICGYRLAIEWKVLCVKAVTKMDWVTSDSHFGHSNILLYVDRPFLDVKHMDETIINNWNKVVNNDDTTYVLGDFALTKRIRIGEIIESLNGYKILICGGHDRSPATMKNLGFDEAYPHYLILESKKLILSHRPIFSDIPIINVSVENWQFTPIPLPTPKDWLQLCGHSHNSFVVSNGSD